MNYLSCDVCWWSDPERCGHCYRRGQLGRQKWSAHRPSDNRGEYTAVPVLTLALYILAHNSTVRIFFSNYFWCPRSRTFLLLHGGMHYCIRGLHGDVFPSKDSNLSSLVLMGLREIYLMTLMLSFMCPDFRRFPFTWLNLTSPTAKSATTFLTVYTVQPSNNEYFLIV